MYRLLHSWVSNWCPILSVRLAVQYSSVSPIRTSFIFRIHNILVVQTDNLEPPLMPSSILASQTRDAHKQNLRCAEVVLQVVTSVSGPDTCLYV